MAWILPLATSHRFGGIDAPVRILRGLGGGSQGQVFEVAVGEEALALKWYFPTFLRRDPGLAERLAESIRRGSPNGDFLWPLVILDDPNLYTLPLGLQQLASSFSLDWRLVAAGSVVSILPVLVLFIVLQRFILPNASGDAVKG